jgi:transcriptional regulator with XRE-family HTH domain
VEQLAITRQLAGRIRRMRLQRGWTAQQLADRCARAGARSLTRSAIAKIESGIRQSVTADEVAALAHVFEMPVADLLAPRSDLEELWSAMDDLRRRAGTPTVRELAKLTGVPPTTLARYFQRRSTPPWPQLEDLVSALGGDTAYFRDLWQRASAPRSKPPDNPTAIPSPHLAPDFPGRSDPVEQLSRNLANIDDSADPLVRRLVHSEIDRTSDFIKGLSERSEITYEGEDRDWLLALTRNVQETIDAISFLTVDTGGQGFDGGGSWMSDLGQRYLEAQQKALDRGVKIRRIFMFDDPDGANDPDVLRMCAIQQELGIQVRLLDPLTSSGLRTWMFDFIVFDSVISYESNPAAWARQGSKPTIVSTRLVLSPNRVRERVEGFNDLWAAAREASRDELPPNADTPG